jgi:hypothetical protein
MNILNDQKVFIFDIYSFFCFSKRTNQEKEPARVTKNSSLNGLVSHLRWNAAFPSMVDSLEFSLRSLLADLPRSRGGLQPAPVTTTDHGGVLKRASQALPALHTQKRCRRGTPDPRSAVQNAEWSLNKNLTHSERNSYFSKSREIFDSPKREII